MTQVSNPFFYLSPLRKLWENVDELLQIVERIDFDDLHCIYLVGDTIPISESQKRENKISLQMDASESIVISFRNLLHKLVNFGRSEAWLLIWVLFAVYIGGKKKIQP